jgi:hypothetical protein
MPEGMISLEDAALDLQGIFRETFGVEIELEKILELLVGAYERGEFDQTGAPPSDAAMLDFAKLIHEAKGDIPIQ